MLDNPIIVITTKSEKKMYDNNDLPKIIAYVDKKSKGKNTSNISMNVL